MYAFITLGVLHVLPISPRLLNLRIHDVTSTVLCHFTPLSSKFSPQHPRFQTASVCILSSGDRKPAHRIEHDLKPFQTASHGPQRQQWSYLELLQHHEYRIRSENTDLVTGHQSTSTRAFHSVQTAQHKTSDVTRPSLSGMQCKRCTCHNRKLWQFYFTFRRSF